jgi:probable rRNA maturation factor
LEQAIQSVPALRELPGKEVHENAPLVITFLTRAEMVEAHANALGDPSPTDVLSFDLRAPGDPWIEAAPWAEILIDVDTAQEYAIDYSCTVSEELMRYMIHGLLHLAGYDDHDPQDYETMKNEQETCLKELLETPARQAELSQALFLGGGSHE